MSRQIIDFRLRPPYGGYLDAMMYQRKEIMIAKAAARGMEPPRALQSLQMSDLLAEMDDAEIRWGVVTAKRGDPEWQGDVPNDQLIALTQEYPGRFLVFPSPDPTDPAGSLDELAGLLEKYPDCAGVNIEPGTWHPALYVDDPALFPIYEFCETQGVPVVLMAGGDAGPDPTYSSPVTVDHVAARFPGLRILVSHGGWPWVHQILHVAYRRSNVYLSPDGYLFGMAGWRDYVDAGEGFLRDRLIFASCYPFLPLVGSVTRFQEMFSEARLADLLYGNALRFLGRD